MLRFAECCDPNPRILKGERTVVSVLFPFMAFFADAPQPMFTAQSYESDMEIAEGCFRRKPKCPTFKAHSFCSILQYFQVALSFGQSFA